jgi:hypothetical protein
LSRHADALPAVSWNQSTFVVLIGCLGLYLLQTSGAGLAWHFWLNAVREASYPQLAVSLFAISQFAKYVPGGFAQHIARVALGERHGLSAPGMVVSIALEQSWALLAGIAVAATLPLFPAAVPYGISLPSPLHLTLLAALALIVSFAIFAFGGRRRPSFLDRWLGAWRATHPKPRTVLLCFLLYAAGIVNSGWNIDLLARYMLGAQESHALLAISVFAVAWVAGFVTPVSPAGLGVRDAILSAGLTPAYGPGVALAAALSYRLVTSLGDGLAFLVGLLVQKRLAKAESRA